MSFGNPREGLLKEMIDLMNEEKPDDTYRAGEVANKLIAKVRWPNVPGDTPDKTVNSYFSQNDRIFESAGDGWYYLMEAYRCQKPMP